MAIRKSKAENLDLFDVGNATKNSVIQKATLNILDSILNKKSFSNEDVEVVMNGCANGTFNNKKDYKTLFWVSSIGLALTGHNEIRTKNGDKVAWKKVHKHLSSGTGYLTEEDSFLDYVGLNDLKTFARSINKEAYFESLALRAVKSHLVLDDDYPTFSQEWFDLLTQKKFLDKLMEANVRPAPFHPVSLYLSSEGESFAEGLEKRFPEWSENELAIASVIRNWAYYEDPLLFADEDGKRHVGREPWFQWMKTVDAEGLTESLVNRYPEFVDDVNQIMDFEQSTQRVLRGLIQARYVKERTNDESDIIEASKLVDEAEHEESSLSNKKATKKSFQL
jgi:hypothetical protein